MGYRYLPAEIANRAKDYQIKVIDVFDRFFSASGENIYHLRLLANHAYTILIERAGEAASGTGNPNMINS